MEKLKQEILKILYSNKEIAYMKGSCGELGDSFDCICQEDFEGVVNGILKIIQIFFDTENQPNQLGIDIFNINNLYRVIQSQKVHIEMCHNIINTKENWEDVNIKWMSSGTTLDYHTWLSKNYNAPKIYKKELCKDSQ